MKIDITPSGIVINEQTFKLPCLTGMMIRALGRPSRIDEKNFSQIITWDDLGIYLNSKNGNMIDAFNLLLVQGEEYTFPFLPETVFTGEYTIEGQPYKDRRIDKHELVGTYGIYNWIGVKEEIIYSASIVAM